MPFETSAGLRQQSLPVMLATQMPSTSVVNSRPLLRHHHDLKLYSFHACAVCIALVCQIELKVAQVASVKVVIDCWQD